ncbi:MAG: response regulator [Defluviitaleaceae bacterium]|nr:response regulator [Defluviitaleaceae bacterium]
MRHIIMAVDDVKENLEILEAILEDTYDVIKAENGTDALEMLDRGAIPDLILLDLSMPEMDGFQLLEAIRKNRDYDGILALFVTGENDVYFEEKGLSLGAVDYIKKPYVPNVIRIKIRNHIELKEYRDDLEKIVAKRTRQLVQRTQELTATHSAIIMGMSLLSESRDKVTGSHLARIKALTRIVAEKICERHPGKLNPDTVNLIVTYSPLHDVGKISVPDAVLKKQGGLTSEEFEQMKAHTSGGGDFLRQMKEFLPGEQSQLSMAIEIAECHHERFDGSGYPNKLSGEEIPLSARIVSIADIYDALRSPRSYKRGFTHEKAVEIITTGDGRTEPSHFDPIVLDAFKDVHEALRHAYDSNPDPSVLKR